MDAPEFTSDMQRGLEVSGTGQALDCRCCGMSFAATGWWYFYGLCDSCFFRFNEWKFRQRFVVARPADVDFHEHESCARWLERQTEHVLPSHWMAL